MPLETNRPVDGTQIATFHGVAISKLDKEKIKNSSILVCLSIKDNRHCEKDDLRAIVNAALLNYKAATFLIGDETHWHNFKLEEVTSEAEQSVLKKRAIALGSDYLQANMPTFLNAIKEHCPAFNIDEFNEINRHSSVQERLNAINKCAKDLCVPFQIVRWREWVENPAHQYMTKQADIEALYQSEEILKNTLEESMMDFVRRHKVASMDSSLLKMRSRDYLREETPAIFWIAAKLGIDFIAYPGKKVKLFTATHTFFVNHNSPAEHAALRVHVANPTMVANWLEIKFKVKHENKSTLLAQTLFSSPPKTTAASRELNDELQSQRFFIPDGKKPKIQFILDEVDEKLVSCSHDMHSAEAFQLARLLSRWTTALMERPPTPTTPRPQQSAAIKCSSS